jgi:hypothetical protein
MQRRRHGYARCGGSDRIAAVVPRRDASQIIIVVFASSFATILSARLTQPRGALARNFLR